MRKPSLITAGMVSGVLAAFPAYAADPVDNLFPPGDLPAVSGVNWKAAISGGFIDIKNQKTDGLVRGDLSVSIPLTFSTGLQIDGSVGDLGGDTTASIGGHLFARNPATFLLGIWGGYAGIGSNDISRVGPEAEFYLGNITLQGVAGWENSDSNNDDVFALANLAMYPQDNLKLYVGYRRTLERNAGAIGFEWLTGNRHILNTPVSIFAEGQIGEDDHATAWAGIRFYFGGPEKSLIRRHREDDPGDPAAALNQLANQCVPFLLADSVVESLANSVVDSCGKSTKLFTSDMRLKTEIHHVMTLANGLKIYSFKYIWDDDTTHVGLMAQDLLADDATKNAVATMPNGYYAVDYAMLGLTMVTLEEWNENGQLAIAA